MALYERHGESYSLEYATWKAMHSRCKSKSNPAYKNYGAIGITICVRWQEFPHFLRDMGRRPTPRHTIERINNSKGYSPSNCKWATRTEQLQNKRNTRYALFRGKKIRLHEIAKILGMHIGTIAYRAAHGIPLSGEKNGTYNRH